MLPMSYDEASSSGLYSRSLVSLDVSSSHVDSEYHEPKISFYFPLDGDSTQQFVSNFCIFLPFHLKSL